VEQGHTDQPKKSEPKETWSSWSVWGKRSRIITGVLLGIGIFILTLLNILSIEDVPPDVSLLPTILVAGLACFALTISGLFPILSGFLIVTVDVLVNLTPDKSIYLASITSNIAPIIIIWSGSRIIGCLSAIICTIIELHELIITLPNVNTIIQNFIVNITFLILFLLLGELLLRQSLANDSLEARRQAELAEQRRAIARELHDTAVYSTTMLVMRAEAAKLQTGKGADLSEDLDFIARTGRAATSHLRNMLEVLRVSDKVELSAPGSIADRFTIIDSPPEKVIEEQIAKVRAAGIDVNAAIEGDLSSLPEIISVTLSRVVTESCSNIVKHAAHEAPATIMVEVQDESVDAIFINAISEEDSLESESASAVDAVEQGSQAGLGLGLIGQRERVEALGGTIEFSQREDTWIVRASIPVHR
jgi:putative histidine kinase